jgi:hypothetical protein
VEIHRDAMLTEYHRYIWAMVASPPNAGTAHERPTNE